MRSLLLLIIVALAGACVASSGSVAPRLTGGTPRLERAEASVVVEPDGAITVTLAACTRSEVRFIQGQVRRISHPCPGTLGDLVVTAPWGGVARASIVNRLDALPRAQIPARWTDTPVDPLDPRTWDVVGKPWTLRTELLADPITWTPSQAEIERLVVALGGDIDPTVGRTTSPPELVPGPLRVGNDELLAGGESVLELSVENRGAGAAYRVIATTRSSVPALHKLQFSFGRIEPGQSLTRRVRVRLPPTTGEDTAMIVVVFAESNGFSPANVSRRLPIRVVATMPRLVLACAPAGDSAQVDAGQVVRLRCTVRNDGGRLARAVQVSAGVGSIQAAAPTTIDVPSRGRAEIEVPVRIPASATIDQELVIEVTAADADVTARAAARVRVSVRRPGRCPTGRLDRAEYLAKRRRLEEARAAGDLTADEFDRYDAELVGCLD